MSIKVLKTRLDEAGKVLDKIDDVLQVHPNRLRNDAGLSIKSSLNARSELSHWSTLIDTRVSVSNVLAALDTTVDPDGLVVLSGVKVKFQHARFMLVQSYLTAAWSLADSMVPVAARILCPASFGLNSDPANGPKLSSFLGDKSKAHSPAPLFHAFPSTFGWPVALLYSLRNHFVHDGASVDALDVFVGPSSAHAFRLSADGWDRIVQRAKRYGVDDSDHREGGAWLTNPKDDLRKVFAECEPIFDQALGSLFGAACRTLAAHVAFVFGED
ncbi:MAG: hypothetical protein H6716_26565 [Polyangiaceae bacterium]|nr:hypothetical protein [Polyangiaceae bacterium]MCB9647669.1 hypothetical protein [Deltaproteobacteria bacterium]